MYDPERAIWAAWALWMLSWFLAAAWSRPTIGRPRAGAEFLHLLVTMLGFGLLISASRRGEAMSSGRWGPVRLWELDQTGGLICLGLVVLGFVFCWWARLHLGALWSGSITRKSGHRIVDTGPYGLVRHPIYTGLILAVAATAAEQGTSRGVAGAALIALGFSIKARLEERFLREELGRAEYDAYARRTPMLIPRPWPSAKS